MEEKYHVINKSEAEFQMLLNQWKHIYTISIMYFEFDGNNCRALIKTTDIQPIPKQD